MAVNLASVAANSAIQGIIDTATTVGKAALHSLAPDEIEYYLCSMELLDGANTRVAFLSFSVMPTDILENKTSIATITRTQHGIIENFATGFHPRDISIRGTFGKRFRLVNAVSPPTSSPSNYFDNAGFVNKVTSLSANFSILGSDVSTPVLHSGYGLTKLLKRMCEMSFELDERGRPHVLIFTNHALNTSYAVEVLQDSYSQSQDMNMIWQYSLEMKAVAPGSVISRNGTSKTSFIAQAGITAATNAVGGILKDVARGALGGLL